MDAHTRGLPPASLFRQWWAEFITTRVGVRPSTRLRDESIFRCHLEPFFGDMPIDQIGYRDAQRFVAELAATDLSPRTVHKAAGLLAQSLDIAVRARLLDHNPTRPLYLPQVPHREPRFLNPTEVARLADTIAAPYRTFVLVGAYAGLRNGELTALRARRIDPEASTIDVAETRTLTSDGSPTFGPPKSRAGRRTVPVPAFVMNELAADLSARVVRPDELIWTSPAGQPLGDANFRRRIWKPATRKAGLDGLRIHDLRHTCVAMWSRSLASPRAAAKWAGHSDPSLILTVYGGVFDDESDAVMRRLGEYADGG